METAISAQVTAPGPIRFHVDGEPCESSGPMTARARPSALVVCADGGYAIEAAWRFPVRVHRHVVRRAERATKTGIPSKGPERSKRDPSMVVSRGQ